jgi:hypothetical protein
MQHQGVPAKQQRFQSREAAAASSGVIFFRRNFVL